MLHREDCEEDSTNGKSALVTQGGLHVLITDTAVLLPVRVCQSATLCYLWSEFELK